MSEHTKEPWSVFCAGNLTQIDIGDIPSGDRPCVVAWGGFDSTDLSVRKNRANARRIVACVNALAGLNPSGVAALIEAAEKVLGAHDSMFSLIDAKSELRAALAAVRGEGQ